MNAVIFRGGTLLAVTVLLTACIARSAMQAASVGKRFEAVPAKVFVLSYRDQGLTRQFQDSYMETIAAEFARLGSTVDVAKVSGLELVKDGHVKQIQSFKPGAVIVVHFDLGKVFNGFYKGKIFLSLTDYHDNTEVWQTAQTFEAKTLGYGPSTAEGVKFAKQALQQLLQDRVLPGGTAGDKAE